ncbi:MULTISPECIES: response regulator [unclassified Cetobacterium]|uniref:response regulator n=1 Tax=unclassified Cetobacterium TaxID=2630983 RepID=UPI00064658D7|nr:MULTISPECIES: response regulator [unclassified Cetobacterium]
MKKVLVVEDDPMVAMINMEYISKISDLEIVGLAINKEEVFRYLKIEKVDLILMDIFLGGENGLDILKEIRGEGHLTDVIMITSANGSEEIKKALSFGCLDYLIKPFDFERFKCAIRKFYDRNAIFNEKKIVQEDLDKLSSASDETNINLPKGLNDKTLRLVIDKIEELNGKEFSIKEICELVEMSNVSTKKYLDYLQKVKHIEEKIIYGNIGRPQYIYKKR